MPSSAAMARGNASLDQERLKAWEALLCAAPDLDDFGRNVGEVVSRNVKLDKGLRATDKKALFRDILTEKGSYVSFTGSPDAVRRFIDKSRTFQRRGPAGTSPDWIFWRILPEDALRAVVNESLGLERQDQGATWSRFREACIEGNEVAWSFLKNPIALHPNRHQIFAAMRVSVADSVIGPDSWDATTGCRRLGLSRHWEDYRPGSRLWMLRYRSAPQSLPIFVPTVADAEWRSLFRPSPKRAGVTCGYTVPLDGPEAVGEPEIVHPSAKAYSPTGSDIQGENVILSTLPRYLGEVAHGA